MTVLKTIAVTGADGFIGKNLRVRLQESGRFEVRALLRESSARDWQEAAAAADVFIHLAGVNRPTDPAEFSGNAESADRLAAAIEASGRPTPVILASSARAGEDTPYGRSKQAAEDRLSRLAAETASPVAIYRLPNVFGKWCRPNYNSAVATFCHNIAHDLPIEVNARGAALTLLYIDDLIDTWLALLDQDQMATAILEAGPTYHSTVGDIVDAIRGFHDDRTSNLIANVGTGLTRALYATYISYLSPDRFSYGIESHRDPRGAFSEILKTRQAGQFSYFTALPGVTRGGHYHHSKTEKFLIVHGEARFRFRHLLTGETREILTTSDNPVVVETIPGWTHDVTNVGNSVMISVLWANEIFDRARPDTIAAKV